MTMASFKGTGQLSGKIIFITGALGKLGMSALPMFLQRGATVIANDLEDEDKAKASLEQLLPETSWSEHRLLYVQADMSDETQIRSAVERIDQSFGRLDGLYHNVYAQVMNPVTELSLESWNRVIGGTLTSAFLTNKYVLPLMIRSGGGVILNTSSVLGQVVKADCPAYGAAKAGINQLTRVIAASYAGQGIRANVLVPGDIKTAEALSALPPSFHEAVANRTLLGRSGMPDEVSEMAAFLLSDASSYITGALFAVDGGFSI